MSAMAILRHSSLSDATKIRAFICGLSYLACTTHRYVQRQTFRAHANPDFLCSPTVTRY